MKHRFASVLIVLSLLVGLVSIAAAPMASGSATLTSVVYVEGKGVVLTFHVNGNFSRSELKGSVHVDGGGNYGLDCVKVDDETVKCTAPKAVAGDNVAVTWGGSTFWTHVQEIPDHHQYCYGIWDYWAFTDGEWTDFGPHCQESPAKEGDQITYTVPELGFDSAVWFRNDPDACDVPNHGSAYYWAPECGSEPD